MRSGEKHSRRHCSEPHSAGTSNHYGEQAPNRWSRDHSCKGKPASLHESAKTLAWRARGLFEAAKGAADPLQVVGPNVRVRS